MENMNYMELETKEEAEAAKNDQDIAIASEVSTAADRAGKFKRVAIGIAVAAGAGYACAKAKPKIDAWKTRRSIARLEKLGYNIKSPVDEVVEEAYDPDAT